MLRFTKATPKHKPRKLSKRAQLALEKREDDEMIRNAKGAETRKFLMQLLRFRKHSIFPTKQKTLPKGQLPPPPEHYTSWVEYAVLNTSLRTVYLDTISGFYPWSVTHDDLDKALLSDYLALCQAAGVKISDESMARLEGKFL